MTFFIIGSLVGLVLVLTGSGGAIVGLPLLIHLAHMPIREASVMVLPIVGMSALFSLIMVRKFVSVRTVLYILGPTAIASYGASYLKPYLSSGVLLGLVILMASLGLIQLFFSKELAEGQDPPISWMKASLIGLISGSLTTLTGLGGGVVLFPLFKRLLKMSDRRASATSLMTISFSVGLSLFFQLNFVKTLNVSLSQGVGLILGFLCANTIVYFFYKHVPESIKKKFVRGLYALVLVLSIVMLIN